RAAAGGIRRTAWLRIRERLARPREDLDPDAVGVEREEGVVAGLVPIFLGRVVDPRARRGRTGVCGIDLVRRVDLERDVLDADAVVGVRPAVRRPQPEAPFA